MMDNNNGAEWCRHMKGLDVLVLALEIEINLTLEMVFCIIRVVQAYKRSCACS